MKTTICQDRLGTNVDMRKYTNEVVCTAEALGGVGVKVGDGPLTERMLQNSSANERAASVKQALRSAVEAARVGEKPVLVNAMIGKSDFREGSISV